MVKKAAQTKPCVYCVSCGHRVDAALEDCDCGECLGERGAASGEAEGEA
jgi:hypothetical protein